MGVFFTTTLKYRLREGYNKSILTKRITVPEESQDEVYCWAREGKIQKLRVKIEATKSTKSSSSFINEKTDRTECDVF